MGLAQAPSVPIYRIVPDRSKVEVQVFRGGLLKVLGHDHRIVARSFSGTVQWDAGKVKDFMVILDIDSASLTVLDPEASEKDRKAVQKTMESPEVLDVTTFPLIKFRSSQLRSIAQSGDVLTATLIGKLALHGIEKEITFPVHVLV